MTPKADPVPRGCGERQEGGLYLEVGTGPGGAPVEHFLVDPPMRVDAHGMGLSPIGVKVVQAPGSDPPLHHVFDWVGSEHYPNVADFVEEARRFGISRRISRSTDFSKLTPDSRLVLLHSHAWIDQWEAYHSESGKHEPPVCGCPKRRPEHHNGKEMCAALWWSDVEGGIPLRGGQAAAILRRVTRTMPSFSYEALCPPPFRKLSRRLAIFASFPIHRIVAVKDRHGDAHERAADRARASKLPVEFEDR